MSNIESDPNIQAPDPNRPPEETTIEGMSEEDKALLEVFEQRNKDKAAASSTDPSNTQDQGGEGQQSPDGVATQTAPSPPAGSGAPEGEPAAPGTTQGGTTATQGQEQGREQGQTQVPQQEVQEPEFTPIEYAGQKLDRSALDRMVELDKWYNSLDDNAVQAVNTVLTGQAVLIDRETAQRWAKWEADHAGQNPSPQPQAQPQFQPNPQPQIQQPQPQPNPYQPYQQPTVPTGPPPLPDPLAGIDLDTVDPALVAAIRQQQQQTTQLQEALNQQQQTTQTFAQQQAQQVQHQRQQEFIQGIQTAEQKFAQAHEYDPAKVPNLIQKLGEAQILPQYLAKHNGDVTAAVTEALEVIGWQDPDYRQHEIDRMAKTQQQDQASVAARQQKQAALSGSGGSVNRPGVTTGDPAVNPDGTPLTRTQQIAKELSTAMNGSGQQV